MEERKVFCDECRDDINFYIKNTRLDGVIKGEKYSYLGQEACCTECNSVVYIPDVNDINLKALYDEYRKKNGIVSQDVILAIPEKYAIGKRPLSLLLGWGEQTFSRYCDGDMPTKQYSEILQKIYNDPYYYSEILESNKDNLKTHLSYEKSKKALIAILSNNQNQKFKIDVTVEYLLNRCEDITPLALQKALYYVQGFYYAFYNTYIFTEDCEAWIHGPVYRDIYFKYRDYRFDVIGKSDDFDCNVFSSVEKAILDSIIKNLCCYSGKVLEQFTHSESPWLIARGDLSDAVPSDRKISKDLIGNYFNTVKSKYEMINPNDIKVYADYMFKQI